MLKINSPALDGWKLCMSLNVEKMHQTTENLNLKRFKASEYMILMHSLNDFRHDQIYAYLCIFTYFIKIKLLYTKKNIGSNMPINS